jgi:hypothetical protein
LTAHHRREQGWIKAMRIPEITCAALLTIALAGCSHPPPRETGEQIVAEIGRFQHELQFTDDLTKCLHPPLTMKQREYVFSENRTLHEAQHYIYSLASLDDEACLTRERQWCEQHYPGECLAQPGEQDGKLASTEP